MAEEYTREQLKAMDTETLISAFLDAQKELQESREKYESLNQTLQLMMEDLADMKRHRFGRSTEKLEDYGQLSFVETENGFAYFNEAEAVHDTEDTKEEETDELPEKKRGKKRTGKREADLKDLPVKVITHDMTEEDLADVFGNEGYKRLPDEIQRQYYFRPSEIGIEEHHIAVYAGKISETVAKADHPKKLLRNSLVSPSLAAGIMTAKYVNAVPLYRQETSMNNNGIMVTRKNMADWMITLSDRYLRPMYDRIHQTLLSKHVIHADETPVLVNKDGRPAGSKSYMWVYRSGVYDKAHPMVLYEYQKTRKADHPREFLKDFSGVCVTDGYQVYHTVEGEKEDLRIAGCWAHARRKYDEALKALPKDKRKVAFAGTALKLIQAIFDADGKLKDLSSEERLQKRQHHVAPLVDAYFTWVRENRSKVMNGTKTDKGMQYSLNQEKYLREFLNDGEVAMDNNGAERAIRPFCIGKKNWEFCDTVSGANASAIIYSITETARANDLRPYNYLEHLLTIIPEHLDETDPSWMDDLLPWSDNLPEECHKVSK